MFTFDIQVSNVSADGMSTISWKEVLPQNSTKCTHLFVGVGMPESLSETLAGVILMLAALLALIICLLLMVKILNSLLRGTMASLVRKGINADFPGHFAFLTGYVALLIGAGVTVLVQSSSVFTSALTPLVGLGVVTVERVYPLTLGSNIGTTITSILAALTADAKMIRYTMQIAFCHLFFNITGILIFYPIPFMRRIPLGIAKGLGTITAQYRWFAIFYLIAMFLILPVIVFGLSLAGLYVLIGVGVPIVVLVIFVVVVNALQRKRPRWLPKILRSWGFLPKPLRSLEPYDRVITSCCCCQVDETGCKSKCCCGEKVDPRGETPLQDSNTDSSNYLNSNNSLNDTGISYINVGHNSCDGSEDSNKVEGSDATSVRL